jgi:hypothetical protein
MSHKLGICIPYRNRKEHLEQLVPRLSKHLTEQGIEHKFYVGHQVDDKLFNRGAMKNIAAQYAFNDGCDYIAWHDVDMVPLETYCDYSYPEENPIHIATKLSKYNYGLGYDQYFGGVVLFTKEQVEKTNGYSNDYWDWGMEDDDLFWRCYFEGYTTGKVLKEYKNKSVANFDGNSSKIEFPAYRKAVECLNKNHTISILFNPQQQPEKVPIWLIGDTQKKFVEYPIFRKSGGFNYGLSFNNSRAVTMMLYDQTRRPIYNWVKRFENMWTWVTISCDIENKNAYFYINDECARNMNGVKENLPFPIFGDLLRYDLRNPFFLGFDPQSMSHYKGQIAEVKIFNKFFSPEDIQKVFTDEKDGLVLHYDFDGMNNNVLYDKVDKIRATLTNVNVTTEDIGVVENVIPFRREGKFECLPHIDEGFKNNTWAKGATTARNEKRFVTEMQQRKIDYKNDGMNTLKYDLVNTELFTDNCVMINVKL